jgi:hypothetical protein
LVNQASVPSPEKVPDLNHIIFLYVAGNVSIPATFKVINGDPSVDAIAIPP